MLTKLFNNLFYVLKLAGLTAVRGLLSDLHRGFVLSEFRPITRLHACKKAAQLLNLATRNLKITGPIKGML